MNNELLDLMLMKEELNCAWGKRKKCDSFYIEENRKLKDEMKKLIDYNKKLQDIIEELKESYETEAEAKYYDFLDRSKLKGKNK